MLCLILIHYFNRFAIERSSNVSRLSWLVVTIKKEKKVLPIFQVAFDTIYSKQKRFDGHVLLFIINIELGKRMRIN